MTPAALASLTAYGQGKICLDGAAASKESFALIAKGNGHVSIGDAAFGALTALVEGYALQPQSPEHELHGLH